MTTLTIKNRRTKISPGGVITLPLSARKTLQMVPGQGTRVTLAHDRDRITLRPSGAQGGTRVSPKGQLELVGEPRATLEAADARHFWLELDDATQTVALRPY